MKSIFEEVQLNSDISSCYAFIPKDEDIGLFFLQNIVQGLGR